MKRMSWKERNLTLTGNGSSNGGEFNRVKIVGEGDVDGNLTCNRLKVTGQINVDGDLNGEVVKVLGQLSVKGDCNSEAFKVRGTFSIGGLLNAGNIKVRLFGPCEAKESHNANVKRSKHI